MQNLQDIQDKIFFECKNVLESLSKINSAEDLLLKQDLFYEVSERIAFLKILEKNKESLVAETPFQNIENQELNLNFNSENYQNFETEIPNDKHHEELEEEVIFNNELNEIHNEEHAPKEENFVEEPAPIFTFVKEETPSEVIENQHLSSEFEEKTSEPIETHFDKVEETKTEEKPNFYDIISEEETVVTSENTNIGTEDLVDEQEKLIEEKEKEFREAEERRRKIVEFEKQTSEPKVQEDYFKDEKPEKQETHQEKKFRLAHIKGLKSVQSLFDDDPLEHEEQKIQEEPKSSGSLLKSNVPTDFMEAEKPRPEFRLDLNDKISFSKNLFGGSQVEMNETINKINSFKTLDEAKEFLSDIYYEKNWKKADEYAQRLWALVENKFL